MIFQEGIIEGIEKGIEQGIEQGLNLKTTVATENLLKKGFSPDTIAEILEVSPKEIEQIIGNLSKEQ